MAALTLEPAPFSNPLVERDGMMTDPWADWFLLTLVARVQQAAPAIVAVALTGQVASIAATPLVASPASGVYRFSWTARITTPASVSSSLIVAVTYTDGGIVCTQSGAAITGNLTTTVGSGSFIFRSDVAPIDYLTTYAGVGTAMAYQLDVTVEQLV